MSPARKRGAEDDAAELYEAVAKYVKARGGSVVVAGGIQVQEWPGDGKMNFTIAVKCTGRKPEFAAIVGGRSTRGGRT